MRPEFHFTARRGWVNDPHGTTARDGGYDVFFQYVPGRTTWASGCHWGHARGPDLFSLEELPVALAPGDGDDGVWTGSLVVDDAGAVRAFYTSVSEPDLGMGRVRVAGPTDDAWLGWAKGPVVANAPAGTDVVAYRDPFVVRDADGWRMLVGAGTRDGTALALCYTSADLDTWEYEGVALERPTADRDPVWLGSLWECPQVLEVGGRHAMVVSVWEDDALHHTGYALGEWARGRFTATSWGRLTYGPSPYAASVFRDLDGRPCATFWLRGVEDVREGWAGAHSVPYVLTVDADRLVATPHPDLERYRGQPSADGVLPGLAADVVWSPSAGEELVVTDGRAEVLRLVVRDGLLEVATAATTESVPHGGGDVRVVLDAQVVEVSTTAGVLGLVVAPDGDAYRVSAGAATVYPLVRSGAE